MYWWNIFWLVTCIRFTYCGNIAPPTTSLNTDWWEHSVIYEIFLLSFKDTDGDGSGDFKGVIEKLDYIVDLGVTAIWLTPFMKSPLKSGGYDITDYLNVQTVFGTIDDFKDLLSEAHKKNIKVIMDFVPNHTSDEHPWFTNSIKKNDKYANFYIWKDAKNQAEVLKNNEIKPEVPNNWKRICSYGNDTSAWIWHPIRKQFYFTQFAPNLPDLNFRNEDVQKEMRNVLNYWLNLGVDGIRVDALKHVYETEDLLDEPVIDPTKLVDYMNLDHIYTVDQEEVYDLIEQWRLLMDDIKKPYNNTRIIMTESFSSNNILFKYYEKGAQIPSNFNLMDAKPVRNVSVIDSKIRNWITQMPNGAIYNVVLQNHDWKRIPTRFGTELIDGINALSLFLPGVSIIYYGQELGMEDIPSDVNYSRSPMQWDDTKYTGFTDANNTHGPWIEVQTNYKTRNVQNESNDPKSYLNFYKSVMKLRQTETLNRGGLATYIFNDTVYVLNRFLPGFNNYTLVINMNINCSKQVRLSDQIQDLQDTLTVVVGSENSNFNSGKMISVTEPLILNPGATIILTENTPPSNSTMPSSGMQSCTSFIVLLPVICLKFLINHMFCNI
ncbi:Glycoside hydrolase superfamily,Glycosyl hydrolase, family 13, catalytic domain [Cinara cedri]|uniref:alpha-glucosidase n=1 Tax=Cinara cedri TaxID=506608 RepID=A0A5E4N7X5_9HEMI|nr:Glycoside hydrolase superfamily,Glycosyl hydrolase, family 13, catalytic domain [Cinara cedri]